MLANALLADRRIIGRPVLTDDGEVIGKVKAVANGHFKVDSAIEPGYWLRGDLIVSDGGSTLRLTFKHEDLGRWRDVLSPAAERAPQR